METFQQATSGERPQYSTDICVASWVANYDIHHEQYLVILTASFVSVTCELVSRLFLGTRANSFFMLPPCIGEKVRDIPRPPL